MKIVFLGVNDWANNSNLNARAINRAGGALSARVVTSLPHPFLYHEDIVVSRGHGDREVAREVLRDADIIVTTGDGDYLGFDSLRRAYGGEKKPVAAMHIGTAFRQDPAMYTAEDKFRGWKRRFVSPDLYRFVKDDFDARIHFVPPDELAPYAPGGVGPVIHVLHGPSNPALKGTAEVEKGMRAAEAADPSIKGTTLTGLPSAEFFLRLSEFDIFVDSLAPWAGGIGGSAQAAMGMGLALLSDFHHICPETSRFMDPLPGICVTDATTLKDALCGLSKDPEFLMEMQSDSLAWATKHLTPKAIAAYWEKSLS